MINHDTASKIHLFSQLMDEFKRMLVLTTSLMQIAYVEPMPEYIENIL